jgi:hypothetical protein
VTGQCNAKTTKGASYANVNVFTSHPRLSTYLRLPPLTKTNKGLSITTPSFLIGIKPNSIASNTAVLNPVIFRGYPAAFRVRGTMSPATIAQSATASASPPQRPAKTSSTCKYRSIRSGAVKLIYVSAPSRGTNSFDDSFSAKFFKILADFRDNPKSGPLTQKDRKSFIDRAYEATDKEFFGDRPLSEHELKMRAMTKVFYKVLADSPSRCRAEIITFRDAQGLC